MTQPKPKYQRWEDIKRSRTEPAIRAGLERLREEERVRITLAKLREQLGLSQVEAGALCDMPQAQISRLERRSDHLLSTLRRHIEALGGRLEVTAVVGDRRIELDV